MFEIPSTPNISKCIITKDTVLNNAGPELIIEEKQNVINEKKKRHIPEKKSKETAKKYNKKG